MRTILIAPREQILTSRQCLPDIVEAYVGAMFIDSDFNYGEVQRFFDMHMKPYFEDMSIYDEYASKHPMTRLHTTLNESYGCTEYRIMADELPTGEPGSKPLVISGLLIHRTIIGGVRAKSPRYAKIRTATKALEELDRLTVPEFRARYGCDCRNGEEANKAQNTGSGTMGNGSK